MDSVVKRTLVRGSVMLLAALTVGLTTGRADLLQADATLPPPGGAYTLPVHCIAPACLVNATFSGFTNTLDQLSGGNELVTTDAQFMSDVYANNGGAPGAFLGTVSTTGTLHITYFGRSLTTPLGTFNAQITNFMFSGTFNGHTFVVQQSPVNDSTGQTTINQTSSGMYQVSSFFDVFGQFSIDGAPYVAGPGVHTEVSAVPEPGTAGAALSGMAALCGLALRRRGKSLR